MTKPQYDFWSLSAKLQADVDRELGQVASTEWDENHLSLLVIQRVRRTLTEISRVTHGNGIVHLGAEAYKLTGTPERNHGDIAIAIQHIFSNGREIRGLGFYEAKASDGGFRYPAFKFRQLQRLATATPRLSYLLYDRLGATACDDPFSVGLEQEASAYAMRQRSVHARAVGANILYGVRDPFAAAAMYAETFGFHLVSRYFTGRDLDFSRPPADSLKRWLDTTKRAPPMVIALTVSAVERRPVQLRLPGFDIHELPREPLRPLLTGR